jgi:uncharacterized membrane protein
MSAARVTMALSGAVTVAALNIIFGSGSAVATTAVVSLVAALILVIALQRWDRTGLLAVLIGVCCGMLAHRAGVDTSIARSLPVIAQTALALMVGRTLMPDKTPAIQRVAEALHADGSPLPEDIRRYTRRVTWLWALTFATLAAIDLAAVIPDTGFSISSALVGAIDLCIIGGMIVGEFLYRRHRYAAFTVRDFGEFVRRLRHIDFAGVLLG